MPANSDSYEYVIVGAGSAGCVLANRLSADPAVRVLLLEAGGDDTAPEVQIPAAFPALIATERDWAYLSVEQERRTTPYFEINPHRFAYRLAAPIGCCGSNGHQPFVNSSQMCVHEDAMHGSSCDTASDTGQMQFSREHSGCLRRIGGRGAPSKLTVD
jgi:hypothetical protein